MELLGEEVDTEITVLASGSRGRDANDLARAALEDEDIAEANVVAGDGHSVGLVGRLLSGNRDTRATALTNLAELNTVMAFRVEYTVSHLVKPSTERVIVPVLVVVAHLGFLLRSSVTGSVNGFLDDLGNLCKGGARSGNVYSRFAYAN
jgi:hypothetical protein